MAALEERSIPGAGGPVSQARAGQARCSPHRAAEARQASKIKVPVRLAGSEPMKPEKKQAKVLDCKASDNVYLHKDFHGAMCYGIKYLDDTLGAEATRAYLEQFARAFYAPLIERLKAEGLGALEKHWREVFEREEGDFKLEYQGETLVLTVKECPAIAHLKQQEQLFTKRFCETTVVVNETICRAAGYACSCEYQPGEGKCVQKFRRPEA